MEDSERGGELGRLEIDEIFAELRRREQALVNDGARGERAHVKALDFGLDGLALGGVLCEEELTLEFVVADLFLAGDERLHDERLGLEGLATETGGIGGDIAPAEPGKTLGLDGGLDDFLGVGLGVFIGAGQENHADTQVLIAKKRLLFGGQIFLKKLNGELSQDTGAVTSHGIGINGTTMSQGFEGRERPVENVVRTFAGQLGNKPDATGIVFLFRGIER